MSVLVVGIGNTLRGDDGAGAEAAQRLHTAWTRAGFPHHLLIVHQLVPELAVDVAAPDVKSVLFVDASVRHASGAVPPTGYHLERVSETAHAETSVGTGVIGHNVSPQMVLTYANLLRGRTQSAWILGLPAVQFEYGSQFSALAELAVARVVQDSTWIWECVGSTSAR